MPLAYCEPARTGNSNCDAVHGPTKLQQTLGEAANFIEVIPEFTLSISIFWQGVDFLSLFRLVASGVGRQDPAV